MRLRLLFFGEFAVCSTASANTGERMKPRFWRSDWFLGLVVLVAFAAFNGFSDLIPSLERKAYDLGLAATSRTPHPDVIVIGIDETSIANIGRWPWQRDVLAKMTDILSDAKAKVIGSTILLSEPQLDKGYQYVSKLIDLAPPESPMGALLREAEQELNTDRKLAQSYARAGNVLMPVGFVLGTPLGKPDRPLPEHLLKSAIGMNVGNREVALLTSAVQAPIEVLGKAAFGVGHLNNPRDVDGTVRAEPLVLQYYDQLFPSLSLMIAARSLNLGAADIKVKFG